MLPHHVYLVYKSGSFIISLFSFCLDGLSIGESLVFKPPTIHVRGSMYPLNYSCVSFTSLIAHVFVT